MSKKTRWTFLASIAVLAFIVGYGVVAKAWPYPYYYGYFYDRFDDHGSEVLPVPWSASPPSCPGSGGLAIPMWVDSADELINFITCKLYYGNTNNRVGAAFIISTMTGMKNVNPGPTEVNEFAARVRYAQSRGWINWDSSLPNCPLPNTFYQDDRADVGSYGSCGSGGSKIIFSNGPGPVYVLKRSCANPAGIFEPLADDLNFNMSGTSTVDDNTVLPGQRINFTHRLTNSGPTATDPSTIGWTTYGGPSSSGPWSIQNSGNAGTFANGQFRDVGAQGVTVPIGALPNSQICRYISWSPDTAGGGTEASTPVCATVQFDFNLTPTVRVEVNDGATPGEFAEPGDKLEFIYSVTNNGVTQTSSVNCTIYGLKRNGFYPIPVPPDSVSDPGFVQPAHGCPRIFPAGPANRTDLVTETINAVSAADLNKSLCRSLYITPATQTGGTASHEVCARIVAKPYLRMYGGDASAGNGQPLAAGSCVPNANASIIGWNRGSGAAYAGAAVQHAALALRRIYDVSTSQGNAAGAAIPPSGLAFANTAPSGSIFGGSFGSLPCIVDHYKPAGATPVAGPNINVSLLAGVNRYSATGPLTLSGNVNPNQRTVLYVDGNVLITNNIQYPGSWNVGSIPLFELVVTNGNIYISQGVTRIDGVYIAQGTTATSGVIYTCANPALPATEILTSSGTMYTTCRNKLEINGALMAKQVRFMRTGGTLRSAVAGEPNTSANIAEVINFSPSLWLAQPPTVSGSAADYDAITSLPPIL